MPVAANTKGLVILDRDGVINLDSEHYIKSPEEWIPIESSLRAIAQLNSAGYLVAVATNQSGLARGFFDQATLAMIHKKMELALANVGGHIDTLEYCPDHPDQATHNRKPNPGMLETITKRLAISAKNTWFVGDSLSDIQCAVNAGCQPVLVLTGNGAKTRDNPELPSETACYKDLAEFVQTIVTH